jgi:hypothetical protein
LHYICHCMQCRSFIFIWFPIFPIVVLRGHISPSLCSWSQCEGTRKTLRQAYWGSLSLYLGFMRISLCFTSFYRIYYPLVPQTRFSPLSLQFSTIAFGNADADRQYTLVVRNLIHSDNSTFAGKWMSARSAFHFTVNSGITFVFIRLYGSIDDDLG